MKAVVIALCLALLPFALVQSAGAQSAEDAVGSAEGFTMERAQSIGSSIVDRILNLCLQAFFYINTLCYRLTGGRFGIEAYCF